MKQKQKENDKDTEQDESNEDEILFPLEILKRERITNVQFWKLEESDIESILKVTKFGIKKSLTEMMQKIKKEHECKV